MTLLAQEFHDIAPPVDYSLVPLWVVFAISAGALTTIGLLVWAFMRWRSRAKPPLSPRQRALNELARANNEVAQLTPYEFSIRVSDILRRYVSEEYQLPVTRQTSVEFLGAMQQSPRFSEDERALLGDFLNRCDLIQFARMDATQQDSALLLDEARRFVEGGRLATA